MRFTVSMHKHVHMCAHLNTCKAKELVVVFSANRENNLILIKLVLILIKIINFRGWLSS